MENNNNIQQEEETKLKVAEARSQRDIGKGIVRSILKQWLKLE